MYSKYYFEKSKKGVSQASESTVTSEIEYRILSGRRIKKKIEKSDLAVLRSRMIRK
jgi:hypothetical protein